MLNISYISTIKELSYGFRRPECNSGTGDHPLYVNVDMKNGGTHTTWIDSLQAAFAGMQVSFII